MTTTTMDGIPGTGPHPPRAANARKTPPPYELGDAGWPAGRRGVGPPPAPSSSSTWPRLRVVSVLGVRVDSDTRHAPPPFVSARLVVAAMWVFFAAAGINAFLV